MALETKPYDVADYLDSDEMIASYLTESLEGNDPRHIVRALADVARVRGGIHPLAASTGISPEELNLALDVNGNPNLETLLKVIHAFGMKMSFSSATSEQPIAA